MGEGDTLLNAVIGAVASVVLSFLPFGIVLGGAIAGYLQGAAKNYREGATVGALAGLLALLPVLGLLFLFSSVFPVFAGFDPRLVGPVILVAVFAVVVSAVYFVGGGALGGVIGAHLVDEL